LLVEELLDRGASVRVPIRAANYRSLTKRRGEIEWVDGDLRDTEYCTRLVSGMNHVFHLASHRRNVEFHRKYCADVLAGNVEMTLAMTRALKEYRSASVTFFSTANVPPKIDVIRLAQQESNDGYVLGKALCETFWLTAARQYGFPILIVRPVGVYGERDTFSEEGNVIPSLMVKAEAAKDVLQVWGSGKQDRVFLYAHDLITAVLRLLDHDAQGIQYITPPDTVTVARVAELIRDLVRPGLPIEFDASKPEGRRSIAALPPHECLADFPWTPFTEGIKKTYDGWKSKGD
ncbi:MAG: NAD-dependent epimerase/dehydratase family protein, partial [Candidatus Peribacteraceae bacterium]|nr:NAD-dependent epimerase/dehydratase family protein [Candidatus Peribacteraceae bacterium]